MDEYDEAHFGLGHFESSNHTVIDPISQSSSHLDFFPTQPGFRHITNGDVIVTEKLASIPEHVYGYAFVSDKQVESAFVLSCADRADRFTVLVPARLHVPYVECHFERF